jgi:hypothetical protein
MSKKQSRDIEIEGRLSRLEESLEEVRTNHLVHLAADIKTIDSKIEDYRKEFIGKIDRGTWLAITVLTGVIVTLLTLWLK